MRRFFICIKAANPYELHQILHPPSRRSSAWQPRNILLWAAILLHARARKRQAEQTREYHAVNPQQLQCCRDVSALQTLLEQMHIRYSIRHSYGILYACVSYLDYLRSAWYFPVYRPRYAQEHLNKQRFHPFHQSRKT
ncbi:hypothetical protein K432DRAFT_63802 [Lepidopterella palustris CBS 459.81]|uniref:Uncharacterized protein n=1 Tax=Lepidopterella palustris CBS 459.81 TaxID=1314670 RepID=A0A8E2E9A6_9PEZI|nr:hypothetical protein K432DRAFT_63802 [Lepidopterella palustris CBS 459.81]